MFMPWVAAWAMRWSSVPKVTGSYPDYYTTLLFVPCTPRTLCVPSHALHWPSHAHHEASHARSLGFPCNLLIPTWVTNWVSISESKSHSTKYWYWFTYSLKYLFIKSIEVLVAFKVLDESIIISSECLGLYYFIIDDTRLFVILLLGPPTLSW